jgi:hypothetical protein
MQEILVNGNQFVAQCLIKMLNNLDIAFHVGAPAQEWMALMAMIVPICAPGVKLTV